MIENGELKLRFIYYIMSIVFAVTLSLPMAAHAQFEDLGGILEDILSGTQRPGQTPIYGEAGIENIPVIIRYDEQADDEQLDDAYHMLILSAYTPKDAGGSSDKARLLGQTRLLMRGLKQPLQLTIPVPRHITKELTFSRITAEVIDENENQVLTTERDGVFRGTEAPELTLKSTYFREQPSPRPDFTGYETISGAVSLNDPKARLNGGTLTIQLLENALAGGTSVTIAGEKVIALDQAILPIPFSLDRGTTLDNSQTPLAFKAWINDWAGRKTHVIRNPVDYNGPDIDYKLKLDVLAQGTNTRAGRNLNPNLMAQSTVTGEARFDPRSGMPGEAKLKVTLSRSVGAVGESRILSTQTILLRGFKDRIPFALSTASTNFDPLIPAPILHLQIIDRNDRVYFDSGEIRAKEGPQTIQLYARR